jgi:hypothetical protein
MSSLHPDFETLQVSGITDISQIQHITETIPTMKSLVIDSKGNFLDIKTEGLNVNGLYVSNAPINILTLSQLDTKGNFVELK